MVILGAVIGDAPRWACLKKLWCDRLAKDGISYFKSSQCKSRSKQFHKFRDVEKYPSPRGEQLAAQVQEDLDAIIRQSNLMCIGAVVPMDIYNRFKSDPGCVDKAGSDPYHWAVQAVWGECAAAMIELGRNNIITFVHDDSENFHVLLDLYRQYKRKNKKHAKVMADFDKLHTSIQAADVAAGVIFRYAEDWAANPTPANLKRLRENMYKIVHWNEEAARYAIALEVKNPTDSTPSTSYRSI